VPLCGVLSLDKPGGWSSRQAVDAVERLARKDKMGHAGTLDPLATGVLVVCVGAATRLIEYVQRMPKRYVATFLLGRRSPTEDVEGDVTELSDPPVPTSDELAAAARRWTGPFEQRPPAYSALKVEGRRAYKLARRGQQVNLKPRPVVVHRLEVVGYAYPELKLEVECGGGTYVRSLGRDLAESLGTAAVMSALRRTAIGSFTVDEAVDPRRLTPASFREHLLPPLRAVERLPRVTLSAEAIAEVQQGRTVPRPSALADAAEVVAVDEAGRLAAILVPRGDRLGPLRNFPL
jgi:tRNA pseudouridine55 synthase